MSQADSLIRNLVDLLPSREENFDDLCEHRQSDDEQRETSQGTIRQIDKKQDQGDDAGNRSCPDQVEET